MISINNFTKGFERDNLFEEINLVIHPDRRIALAGKNGSGKTTFLRCLAGQEEFLGRIVSDGIKISIMEQENNFESLDKTFEDYIREKRERLGAKKLKMESMMGEPKIYEDEDKFNSLMDRYNLLLTDGVFALEMSKLIGVLGELGIGEKVLEQRISELSGGQKIKLRLAECIAAEADLYLLDEPTNHLDLDACEWLGNYIKENVKSLIVISHDRYFLNEIVDEVWKIEEKKIEKYVGGYEAYEAEEVRHHELLARKFRDATKRKAELMESVAEKRHWAMLVGNKSAKCTADRLEREANEIDPGINPEDLIVDVEIDFSNKKLHNCELFRFKDFGKEFDGRTLFRNFNQEIMQGEKIAIIGENGAGKTTLLRMLMGEEEVSFGSIYRRAGLKIGYFDQELRDVDHNVSMIKFLETSTGKRLDVLTSALRKFGFEGKFLDQKISKLSGREKGRLNLLRIGLEDSEVLLLDEPTNNLDIHLKDSLERAINEFSGTVIIVSHDRHFIDKVATRILDVRNGAIESYSGNYSDYIGRDD